TDVFGGHRELLFSIVYNMLGSVSDTDLQATVRGGGYAPGTPREGWDHSTPYLRRVLADMWQADLTIVERELTLAATSPGMEHLRDLAAGLHAQALTAARAAGRATAARRLPRTVSH
ncbi:hypothetical protein ACWCSD_47625, partial [Nonomuraea sp. NPDC001684]